MSAETASAATPPARPSAQERAWLQEERAVAKKYLGRVPWEMVAWGLGNTALWLALWPLVFTGTLPLWAGFLLATLCCTLSYLPSHEAQHSIIGTEGSRWRWLNELLGHVSLIPLPFPYKFAWLTHKEHHAHANDPERDPDHFIQAPTVWGAVWNSILATQPGARNAYRDAAVMKDKPGFAVAVKQAALISLGHYAVLAGLASSGYALEALLLWWLPRHIALTYIRIFLSWAPHYPMDELGRYRDTRGWKSPVGTVLSLWMEFHVIHHLFPRIPLFQTRTAYWEMRDMLAKRGLRIDGL